MISVQEARRRICALIPAPVPEEINLSVAAGRVLAQEVQAKFPMPRFNNSAMDGFAVRHDDLLRASKVNPVILKSIGVLSPGGTPETTIRPGECMQCMTGAPLPMGADAVVMVEHTSGFGSKQSVEFYQSVRAKENVRFQGEEIRAGEILLLPGTRIDAAEIGVMATFGYDRVLVYSRPKMALFATGDELVEPGEFLSDGKIYNSNLPVLADLSGKAGAEVISLTVLRDKREELEQFLFETLAIADIVVSSGGVSMGRYDYVREIFLELGVREHFWKVAQKPGKPLFFGTAKQTLIFGLPGNPVSAFIGFMEYVWPVIKRRMGQEPGQTLPAVLADPFPRDRNKYRFLFGQVWLEDGQLYCAGAVKTGSHMLTASLNANCIIGVDKGKRSLLPGVRVNVRLLPWKSILKERT